MEKYNFKESEKRWQDAWLENKVYKWQEGLERKENFVIDTPPPTVSGQLHIGHVYSYCHTDIIARFKRMQGYNVFYPVGFDDNGLPTERLVEKKKKIKASKMDRSEFVDICKEVVVEEEIKFRNLFNRIALSVDWSQEYQTISERSQRISQLSFLDLIQKNQLYRQMQPILWDPVDQTALSQADIEEKERESFMYEIIFAIDGVTNPEEGLVKIATTRPELLAACTCVFYHPDDKRYTHLEGKSLITPIFGVKVPLIADDLVKIDKGTGLVMCCTFGDQTDIIWWRTHNLPTRIIINKYGKMLPAEFGEDCQDLIVAKTRYEPLVGQKVENARQLMVQMLKNDSLICAENKIIQNVKCAERSSSPLEIIPAKQWFVKATSHKEDILKRSNELNWYPHSMKIKLDSWTENVSSDWCISRQRFFGVPIPVWYSKRPGEEGKIILPSPEDLPVDPSRDLPKGYAADEVDPDFDVMDTWSTSSVTPQLNSHSVSDKLGDNFDRHQQLFPADLRPQAHEIIRTWAFYTILKSYLHQQSLPWKNIMVSGWCLAEDKSKMSKSKGNIINPEEILDRFGADVIRYWTASSRLGGDTTYSEEVLKCGKKTISKMWNACKFASAFFDRVSKDQLKNGIHDLIRHDYDRFFTHKLNELVDEIEKQLNSYEYAHAMLKLEQFFWKDFCDNYLEIVKTRAYNENNSDEMGATSAVATLYNAVGVILRLYAPFMPHITEEIYHILNLTDNDSSIHTRGNWPIKVKQEGISLDTIKQCQVLEDVLGQVRKDKAQKNLSIKAPISLLEIESETLSKDLTLDLCNVISAKTITFRNITNSGNKQLDRETHFPVNIQINYD